MRVLVNDGAIQHAEVSDARHDIFSRFFSANPGMLRSASLPPVFQVGDAATEAESFAIGQLTYLEQKAFARKYQPMRYQEILGSCISYEAGPWAKAVDYLISDEVGIGRKMSPAANDIPMVDVAYAKKTIPVAFGGIGYDYTLEDLRTSAYLRQPLPTTKQAATIQAYMRHMNFVALQGEAASNFTGVYNNGSATAANRASGAVWDSATADTIVADVIDGYTKFRTGSGDTLVPTQLVLPLSSINLLYKPRATGTDTTIKKFLEETLKIQIISDIVLDSVANGGIAPGAGATKRCVFMAPDNDNMVLHIPMPVQFLAPQLSGYRVIVLSEYKYAGFELRRPYSIRYMDAV